LFVESGNFIGDCFCDNHEFLRPLLSVILNA
jgi:hypothetical protein